MISVAIPPQASTCGFGGGGETSVERYSKNNLQLADLILAWIDKHVEAKKVARR